MWRGASAEALSRATGQRLPRIRMWGGARSPPHRQRRHVCAMVVLAVPLSSRPLGRYPFRRTACVAVPHICRRRGE